MDNKKPKNKNQERLSIFWLVILILFLRWAVVEPFKIPSGSMIPTLLIGDHLFVSKSAYDIRVPFLNQALIKVSEPRRGDVIVFEYPREDENQGKFYIKRLMGVPGDRIEVRGGVPYLNGTILDQKEVSAEVYRNIPGHDPLETQYSLLETVPNARFSPHWVQRDNERLEGLSDLKEHLFSRTGRDCIDIGEAYGTMLDPLAFNEICPFTIPEGQYFMMGDNRDHSSDGRYFGLIERKYIKGKAIMIWMSLPLSAYEMQQSLIPSIVSHLGAFVKMWSDFPRLKRAGMEIH
jgi:signal peptidase I